MNILKRILKSIHDGNLAIKILNRFSRYKYVLDKTSTLDKYLAEYYPNEKWKKLSKNAKVLWINFFTIFEQLDIKNIVYVGANDGSVALTLDEAFPGCVFHLIEPNPEVFAVLAENTVARKNMSCHHFAAGASDQWVEMFVDEFSPASSILKYNPVALKEFPFLGKQRKVKVHVLPLDDILKNANITGTDFLIVDVQGYENEVFNGAFDTLLTCKAIMSELSLEALYRDSSTFDSVFHTLNHAGFYLRYLLNPIEGTSRKILQIDGLFVHKGQSL